MKPIPLLLLLASCISDPPIPPVAEEDAGVDASVDPCAAPDGDGDLHAREECGGDDCADDDATQYPGAPDDVGDTIDQNCDGQDGVDADGDGYPSVDSGGTDCDDGHADINPGIEKVDGEDWVLEVPDEGDTGGEPSVFVDEDDVVHITYTDIPQGDVRYVDNASGAWSVPELVDDEGYLQYTSLAVHDGVLHVAYEEWSRADTTKTNYARKEPGGAWVKQTLAEGWGMVFPVVAVSDDGVAHVAWGNWSTQDGTGPYTIDYATDASGEMVVETVEDTTHRAFDTAIAVDPDGVPHVAYSACQVGGSCYGSEPRQIRYATRTDAGWDVEALTAADAFIPFLTLAMDADGNAHLAWGGAQDQDLVYGTNASGDWVTDSLVSGTWTGVDPRIAVDSAGYVGIAYLDWSDGAGALSFLSNRTGAFPERAAIVDLRGTGGYNVSLALDSRGSPHIAYFQSDEWYLGYAHTDGLDENCDGLDW